MNRTNLLLRINRKALYTISIGILVLVAYFLVTNTFIKTSIKNSNLYPHNESFTELYFVNPQYLPAFALTQQELTFKFAVHNLEQKDMYYPFTAYLLSQNKKKTLDNHTVFIKSNTVKTITEEFNTADTSGKNQIVIMLPNQNQKIDFWMEIKQ